MPDHQIIARFFYQVRFIARKIFSPSADSGISILLVTWNRATFLRETLRTLADTIPAEHEILVWDNGSTDETKEALREAQSSKLNMKVFYSDRNIGTSGYAKLALHARYDWLMELDDDILLLPPHWFEIMTAAFRAFPELGYLALDVVQDEFTNGAKPASENYAAETRGDYTVEFGPTGGWATMIPRALYFQTEGLPFRPHKPFFAEDAYFQRVVETHGQRAGILQGIKVYHATGLPWNAAFGYDKLRAQKNASPGAAPHVESTDLLQGKPLPSMAVLDTYRA